ncbi:MAG: TldD/PmbA family protein [Candidatus Kariarchaeaceae archaeon]|jgi:PmbA protein
MNEQLESYVDKAVEVGNNLGADYIIVRGINRITNQIRFSQNKIDINKEWQIHLLELFTVVNNNQVAVGEFSPTSEENVKERVEAQIKFAHKMTPSPSFQGIETEKSSYDQLPGIYDQKVIGYREKAPETINACIESALTAGATRVAGSFFFGDNHFYLKNSAGPKGSYSTSYYNLTVRAFQDDMDASGQGLACGTIPSSSESKILEAGQRAGNYSKLHLGAKQAKAGKFDIIMAPAVAANLLGTIPDMANPRSVMMGRSALGDKMGEQLSPEFVSIFDNGLKSDGLGSAPFDFEGTPRKKTKLFDKGVLVNFIHNTSTSSMFQGKSTGNSDLFDLGIGSKFLAPTASNFVFNNGDFSFEELLEGSSNPTVFVLCNWYTRYTSRISTEYSTIPRDAAFLVENGELGQPIKNFRISDNLLRQFSSIDAMGNDQTQVQWWEVEVPTWIPTIRVKDCRITTATQ